MSSQEKKSFSNTVNLPVTSFPQRGSLPTSEPARLQQWEETGLRRKLERPGADETYVLHDGPPYANGNIHIGHALNKTLKDIIVRYKSMKGYSARYVPGWDCHGLPIEQKVVEELKENGTYDSKTPLEIRQLCKAYALKWVDVQREQFKRLGICGDWENPYITLDPKFEVGILESFADLVKKGYVYKGLKVVFWDPVFETALADAEIEYNDAHVSPSIYVKFAIKSTPAIPCLKDKKVSVVIWTTTPWTIPANLGVSLHPDEKYSAYEVNGEVLVIATQLLTPFKEATGLEGGAVLGEFPGRDLDRQVCRHPLMDKDSLVMVGDHVTMEQGTGCVHTAPGHGVDDFHIGAKYGLPVFNPVDEAGKFTSEYPDMEGVMVFDANPMVVEKLKENGVLLASKPYTHSYPYSWRSHKPVIMRATEQWFMDVGKNGLREKALEEIRQVDWVPKWGYDRISNMVNGRPDWCLSRQRSWGVPIPSVQDTKTGGSVLNEDIVTNFTKFVATEGTDCWFVRPVEDFLPESMKAEPGRYAKEFNCLDVWFDSGSTHHAVLNDHYGLTSPADLYLEGSDQHRGWFQSSLWVSMGMKGVAPYRQVLTHGFVLDEKGRPMSKSLGNVINPLDVIGENGADVLRMWVSSEDYRNDVSISKTAIQQISTAYRRIRNTLRFVLGNLYDFNPATDRVAYAELGKDDRWCLSRLSELIRRVVEAYDKFEFHRVYQLVNGFCVNELGSLYLDITKDRLYCEDKDGAIRRRTQTVMYELGTVLPRLLAPILVFTSDEAYGFLPGDRKESVHLDDFPKPVAEWTDEALESKWERLLALRSEVTSAIEPLRAKENKVLGNSLEAKVTFKSRDPETIAFLEGELEMLAEFLIVSQVTISQEDPGSIPEELKTHGLHVSVQVTKAEGEKCPRCRRVMTDVGNDTLHPEVCGRCAGVMRRAGHGEETSSSEV